MGRGFLVGSSGPFFLGKFGVEVEFQGHKSFWVCV